jgi:glycosyltransferase involved in cell wall biosynthesis
MSAKYSICITHYNEVSYVERSLKNILDQVDERFEVVVVDNFSTDGSYEILKRFADGGRIRLRQVRCSRGKGRQLAFEDSTGEYIVADMDLDDFFLPRLNDLLALFGSTYKDKLLRVKRSIVEGREYFCGITVARRELITKLGGWRDLNWFEDSDIWKRAREANVLEEISFPIMIRHSPSSERRGFWKRSKHRYLVYREWMRARLGDDVDVKVRFTTLPLYLAAWVSSRVNPLPET